VVVPDFVAQQRTLAPTGDHNPLAGKWRSVYYGRVVEIVRGCALLVLHSTHAAGAHGAHGLA